MNYFLNQLKNLPQLGLLIVLCLLITKGNAQWITNGIHIYNSNIGNVGVGIANPSEKFEVQHNTASPLSGGMAIRNSNSINLNSEIKFKKSNGTSLWAIGCDVTHYGVQDFFIYDNVVNNGWGATRFHINNLGNIGIGTISQSEKLEVAEGSLYINEENNGLIVDEGGNKRVGFLKYTGKEAGIWRLSNQKFEIGRVIGVNALPGNPSSWVTDLYIDGTGKVGLGVIPTPNSLYRLFVEDGIVTRDIKVMTGTFPDYVFEKEYELMTISDLGNFIALHKHLPGIPSAKEIKEDNGFEVGNLETKLLEKIEEQALYIISLQNQINDMKIKVEEISNR